VSKPIYTSSAEAEAAFYDALARSDLDKMMSVWAEDDEVVCIHPGGPRLVGLSPIREIWRQMMVNGARLGIEISEAVVTGNTMMAVHSVFEQISIDQARRRSPLIAATNVYRYGAEGWRMVMHHASPVPNADLLGDLSPRVVH
jgi:ketosteroid isomerase-like protein